MLHENKFFQLVNEYSNTVQKISNSKSSKLLSICVPVYNRKYIFKWSLISVCESCKDNEELVEIVVSDNASEDNIYSIVKEVSNMYPLVDILYNCNSTNIGMSSNIFKVVEGARGQFCWAIGSDDFIKQHSINTIINILQENIDIDFIACSFDLINIDTNLKITEKEMETDISERLKDSRYLMSNGSPTGSFKVDRLEYILDPVYNNVLFGALMTGIFKRDLWNEVAVDKEQLKGFDTLLNVYPHIYVYCNAFLDKKAYYCGQPLITVGEGAREWSTDTIKNFWESSLPIIYFKVFAEMSSYYKKYCSNKQIYIKCENWLAGYAADLLVPIIWKKYVTKEPVKNMDKLSPLDTSSVFFDNEVYRYRALSKLKAEYENMKNQYNSMEKSPIGNIIINLFKDILENYN